MMKDIVKNLRNKARRYVLTTTASIAIAFAVLAPVLVGAAGVSLDFALAYLVQQRLAAAIDAAALAGAAASTDPTEIEAKIVEFFDANYPDEEFGYVLDPEVTVTGDQIHVSVSAYHDTTFVKLLGIDELEVDAETTVIRQVQGIEVVMVLDVTGSMGGSKIESLRTAAANFVYIMYGIDIEEGADAAPEDLDDMAVRDREFIKIGMVPYSSSVNVGPYGLGEDLDGAYYGVPFVNNPHNKTYKLSSSTTQWAGCVLAEKPYPIDVQDHEGPWDMYRYCRKLSNDNYNCSGSTKKPNYNCPLSPITPLVTSPTQLRESIDTFKAQGHTYGNFGMVWGWRVLSPEYPFEEARDWDNQYWKKAIIMMTDGVNTIHSRYSAYGFTSSDGLAGSSDQDSRLLDVCDALKERGVTVYTVTFSSGSTGAKSTYRKCATTEDYYFHAPDDEDLVEVFETISRQLSNLHISQ